MPKVSVIVPVYGVEKYMERCARSLFEQTLDDIEYIFVDDCTPDRSIEILSALIKEYRLRFAEMNYSVRIERMSTNSGLPAVPRHGIQLATGDYIIHCDSDDWVDTTLYEKMYSKAKAEDSDLVIAEIHNHNGSVTTNTLIGCLNEDKKCFINDMLFQNVAWSLCNKLFKSSLYNSISVYPTDNMGEDMVLVMQMVVDCAKISRVDDAYYYYFNNTSSICRSVSIEKVLDRCQQYLNNYNIVDSLFKEKRIDVEYHKGLNWVKYSIKSMLYSVDKNVRVKRKGLFPLVEYKVLFYPEVSKARRNLLFRNIIGSWLFKK